MWLHYILIIYILILGVACGRANQSPIAKRIYFFLVFGTFAFLAAFRANTIGNDTYEYIRIFNNIAVSKDIASYTWRYEEGYLYLNKLISMITLNPQFIIIVTSIFVIFGFAKFIYRYSKIPWLSTYLFFTLGYFGMSMNTIRSNIALVIILYSYRYLRERKLFKFIFIVFLASLFHRVSLFFLLAYPITYLKYNFKTILLVISSSIIVSLTFSKLLNVVLIYFPRYQYYIESKYLDGDTRTASVLNFLVGLSIIIFGVCTRYHLKEMKEELVLKSISREKLNIKDGQNMLMLIITGVAVIFISFNFSLLDRIGNYYIVFAIIYLPNAIIGLKNRQMKMLSIFLVVGMFFIYSTTIQIMRPEWNVIYPYKFFWQMSI
ncbi:EpsG family protein [Defluviitalea raffinosedens]|uniref:EpsG family protein n=1 Tax=Defluviitalea raffinosedens TaxID=1450156 RepID=UPI00195B40E4|nr:EpsG family protein [Defluviitalea raffinosedens]MBM7685772.1 hypothetical protein [Defluviitalea raffinosedens]